MSLLESFNAFRLTGPKNIWVRDHNLVGHLSNTFTCAIAADGSLGLSASDDKTARLWHLGNDTHEERAVLKGHKDVVRGCALSADGSVAATASWDGSVRVWDVASGKQLNGIRRKGCYSARGCALSHNGQSLVAIFNCFEGDDQVVFYDCRLRHVIKVWRTPMILVCVAMSRDAKIIAFSGKSRTGHVGEQQLAEVIDVRNAVTLRVHNEAIANFVDSTGVALSALGQVVAFQTKARLRVCAVQNDSGQDVLMRGYEGSSSTKIPALTSDGSLLIAACKGKVFRVWNAKYGALLASFDGHVHSAVQCAISEDGNRVVSVGGERSVRVWEPRKWTNPRKPISTNPKSSPPKSPPLDMSKLQLAPFSGKPASTDSIYSSSRPEGKASATPLDPDPPSSSANSSPDEVSKDFHRQPKRNLPPRRTEQTPAPPPATQEPPRQAPQQFFPKAVPPRPSPPETPPLAHHRPPTAPRTPFAGSAPASDLPVQNSSHESTNAQGRGSQETSTPQSSSSEASTLHSSSQTRRREERPEPSSGSVRSNQAAQHQGTRRTQHFVNASEKGPVLTSLLGGLAAIPLDGGAGAIISGVVVVASGINYVVQRLLLVKENPAAALELSKHMLRLQDAIQLWQKKVPRETSELSKCMQRTTELCHAVDTYAESVIVETQDRTKKLLGKLVKFHRSKQVAQRLMAFADDVDKVLGDLNIIAALDTNASVKTMKEEVMAEQQKCKELTDQLYATQRGIAAAEVRKRFGLEEIAGAVCGAGGDIRQLLEFVNIVLEKVNASEAGVASVINVLLETPLPRRLSVDSVSSNSTFSNDDVLPEREKARDLVQTLLHQIESAEERVLSREMGALAKEVIEGLWEPWRIIKKEDLIFGKELGRGACGVVYRGKWKPSTVERDGGIPVAVKKIAVRSFSADMYDKERAEFEREAGIMRDCRHPCVLKLHGAMFPNIVGRRVECDEGHNDSDSSDDGLTANEAEDGQELSATRPKTDGRVRNVERYALLVVERMKCNMWEAIERRRLSDVKKVEVLRDVAIGMKYLHSKRIVHLDLKPQNVLVNVTSKGTLTDRAKISDFGASQQRRENSMTHSLTHGVGTCEYMAPEMLLPRPRPRMACDVFSFGAMICVVLATRMEVSTYRSHSLVERSRRADSNRLSSLLEGCLRGLGDEGMRVIAEMCVKDDAEKRPSFDEIARAMQKVVDGESVDGVRASLQCG